MLVTNALLMQGAIMSVMDKKGNKAFRELIQSLGGGQPAKAEEPTTKKRTATPAVKPGARRDQRIPKPPPRRSKEDLLK